MKFFLDNCISKGCCRALVEVATTPNTEIVHLTDMFAADTPDVEWIRRLRADGQWIIVSGDVRISTSNAERMAWHESGLTAFFLGDNWAQKKLVIQAHELFGWWSTIVEFSKRYPSGYGFLFQANSKKPRQIFPRG